MKKFAFIFVTALATLFNTALRADDYPTRPITLVAVFGPGSASDTICRIIADKLSPMLGQPLSSRIAQVPTERWQLCTSIISRRTATRC